MHTCTIFQTFHLVTVASFVVRITSAFPPVGAVTATKIAPTAPTRRTAPLSPAPRTNSTAQPVTTRVTLSALKKANCAMERRIAQMELTKEMLAVRIYFDLFFIH